MTNRHICVAIERSVADNGSGKEAVRIAMQSVAGQQWRQCKGNAFTAIQVAS